MAVEPDPWKLLLPDPDYVPSLLSDKAFPIYCAAMTFGCVLFNRYSRKMPLFSGIQSHLLWTGSATLLGIWGQRKFETYNMERDARFRHYMEIHPEDFPMPERKKVGEVFKPWTPIR